MISTRLAAQARSSNRAPQGERGRLLVFWHHGTPNLGSPPALLFPAADRLGLRWVSYDRPGYGGSSPHPGRAVASAAADVAEVADALGLSRFAVMGHSGGGPHALACGALLPDRVMVAVSGSGLAPVGAAGLDWFAGMHPAGATELHAAAEGRAALETYLMTAGFDPKQFTPADHAGLDGPWAWLAEVAGQAIEGGIGGAVDDNLALRRALGLRSGRDTSSGPVPARGPGPHRAQSPRGLAGGPHTLGRTMARPGDGHVFGPQ